MRAMILVAGASLAIAACNRNETADNATSRDGDLTAQNITANDTTSIDAATAEDANMAAETVIDLNDLGNADGNDADNGADDDETGNNSN